MRYLVFTGFCLGKKSTNVERLRFGGMFASVLFVERGRHDHASCGPWAKDPGGFVDIFVDLGNGESIGIMYNKAVGEVVI